ncbi:type II toxin-antitoxin system VapC family toxin [Brevundimonas subvibrioides]|uniref:type II toxin-antitoxin system VapC family toxin n=1 Tax=Brevundimonas subvibrioides TaxID=74313 RepID=UPI0022B2D60C|nr:type II toxin-antitoxin system VapC family toxin [Brevundimonas subvibrioides]
MVKALFDTNILIDHLNAAPEADAEIDRYDDRAISIITWIEVMAGADAELADPTRTYLDGYSIVALDDPIAERAASIRQSRRMKLPDAIIWATAQTTGRLLVTRNTKDFPADDPGVRAPYVL